MPRFLIPFLALLTAACGSNTSGTVDTVPVEPETPELTRVERGPTSATRALVFLHGYGGSAAPYARMADELAGEGLLFVFPEGTVPLTTGFGWWDIGNWRAEGEFRDLMPEGLFEASEQIQRLLTELEARGIPRRCVVVAGFSQGAVLAMDVGLVSEPPIAGIGALGGTLVARPRWAAHWSDAPPILMTHGRQDRTLPFRYADGFRQDLEAAGAPLTFEAFEGEHTITRANLDSLQALVERTTAGCQ